MRLTQRFNANLLLIAGALVNLAYAGDPDWIARSKAGMVASDSPEASQVGAAVLKAGGNAFDAAVATSFALAVARLQSTGLGGGGFMVAYVAKDDRFITLDFRETAPAAATPERYAKLFTANGDGPSPSVYGGNAVGVPGQLAGLVEINRRFGEHPLAELIQPAIELAEGGFVIDEEFIHARREAFEDADKWPQLKTAYAQLYELLSPAGVGPKLGGRLKRPALAKALRLLAEQGPDAFYDGPIGEAIVRAVQDTGGVMTMDDLRDYRVKQREPLRFQFYDAQTESTYEFVTMPPPSSGGVCMAEFFNIMQAAGERSDLHPVRDREHVVIEAMKHAFADRARWLGDPDFCEVPVAGLISQKHAAQCARRISARGTLPAAEYGTAAAPPDDGGTSHFCVADRDGNIVALTETVNGNFGALVVAEPYGIILNNEMDDFLTVRGQANLYGLVQSERNLVAPGKRPLSSMSPTIVLKNGKPFLVLGASGGPRIITSVLQVAQHVMDGQPIEQAMTELRLHHQWQPDEIYFDREPPADVVEHLKQRSHQISDKRQTGIVQAIQLLDDGTMVGASDPKKGGRPAGAD
jgi:gamma-glutamyltranspeptidase/glutathione hydrolase